MFARLPIVSDMPTRGDEALACDALDLAGMGAFSCDLRDEALIWTPGTYRIFGLARDAMVDRRAIVEMYTPKSRSMLDRLRTDAIARCGRFAMDAEIVRADGVHRWMRLTAQVDARGGRAVRLYGLKQDITEEKTQFDALRRLVDHDPVTGLPARTTFESRACDGDGRNAVILFGIEGLKALNDHFGRDAGDACLCVAAERITASLPESIMIARIGGGAFAALMPPASALSLARRASSVLRALTMPIACAGEIVHLTASAGIAVSRSVDPIDPVVLLTKAEAAMYQTGAPGTPLVRVARVG